MGVFRGRPRRLEEAAREDTMTLDWPECGAEFVVHGDVPIEFIVHRWARETGEGAPPEHPLIGAVRNSSDPGWSGTIWEAGDPEGWTGPVEDFSE